MPYRNYHSCRVKDPALFDRIRAVKERESEKSSARLERVLADPLWYHRRRATEEFVEAHHSCEWIPSRDYDDFVAEIEEYFAGEEGVIVLVGQRKDSGKWETQAIRYPVDTWDEKRARASCSRHGGTFEPAAEQHDRFALETQDVGEIDIMAVGTWNGKSFTEKDLREVAQNFETLKDRVKAWLSLGHSGRLGTQQRAGMPAVGWFNRVWYDEQAQRLRGYLADVPKKLVELIKAGAYRTVSAEYIRNFVDEATGKKYNRVFVGAGLLGAELPAVTTNRTLDQVAALYSDSEYEHETVEWELHANKPKGGDTMDELTQVKEKLATATESLKRAEAFIAKVLEKFGDVDRDELLSSIDALVTERNTLKTEVEKQAKAVRDGKIDDLFRRVSGKLLPKEEEKYRNMLEAAKDVDAEIAELEELFTAKQILIKTTESAKHDPTGGRGENFSRKADEEDERKADEEFLAEIEHELDSKGMREALSDESREAFLNRQK